MIAWFVRHAVAANLLMMSLLLAGLLSANHMRKEIIPKLPASEIIISAYYEGRTAEQIDRELGQKNSPSTARYCGHQAYRCQCFTK